MTNLQLSGSLATSIKSFSATNTTLMDNRTIAPTYFFTGDRFPIELRAIEHSRARFRNFLARRKSGLDFFARSPRGGDIARQLGDAAHMGCLTKCVPAICDIR